MTNKLEISREQAADSLYLTMWPNDTLHECEAGNPKWNACLKAVDAGLRDSDVKHYFKRADFHARMVALIDTTSGVKP